MLLTIWSCQQDVTETIEPVSTGQTPEFKGTRITSTAKAAEGILTNETFQELENKLSCYQLYQIETANLSRFVSANPGSAFRLALEDSYQWDITLEPSDLIAPDLRVVMHTDQGSVVGQKPRNIYYQGTTSSGGRVRLILDEDRISGVIREGDTEIHLGDTDLGPGSDNTGSLVVYSNDDLINSPEEGLQPDNLSTQVQSSMESNQTCDGKSVLKLAVYISHRAVEKYDDPEDAVDYVIGRIYASDFSAPPLGWENYPFDLRIVELQLAKNKFLQPFNDDQDMSYANFSFYIWATMLHGFSTSHDGGILFTDHRNDYYPWIVPSNNICNEGKGVYGVVNLDRTFGNHTPVKKRVHGVIHDMYEGADLACLCEEEGWYLFSGGMGSGVYVSSSGVLAGSLKWGDFNADGKEDILTHFGGGLDGEGMYVQYSGTGGWIKLNSSGVDLSQMRIGDFDGNGQDDILAHFEDGVNGKGQGMYVLSGGAGSWVKLNRSSVTVDKVKIGDFDGNGQDDILAQFGDGQGMYILRGGAGSWVKLNNSGLSISQIKIADFDGNGQDDLLAQFGDGQGMYILRGGTGSWVQLNGSGKSMSQIKIGDFDGDGKADLFTSRWVPQESVDRGWYVSYGSNTSWIKLNNIPNFGISLSTIKLGDFTGDGKTDVLYSRN